MTVEQIRYILEGEGNYERVLAHGNSLSVEESWEDNGCKNDDDAVDRAREIGEDIIARFPELEIEECYCHRHKYAIATFRLRDIMNIPDKEPVKKLEIERKFILDRLPFAAPEKVILIQQFYGPEFRIRQSIEGTEIKHEHCVKKLVSAGVFEEDEKTITSSEFIRFREYCVKFIRKMRYVYPIPGTELKWEVDVYRDIQDMAERDFITAEIELPSIDHPFDIEPYMKQVIREEVTGDKRYFNSTLAISYNAHMFENKKLEE